MNEWINDKVDRGTATATPGLLPNSPNVSFYKDVWCERRTL